MRKWHEDPSERSSELRTGELLLASRNFIYLNCQENKCDGDLRLPFEMW
jgi:hypothetical protein